MIRATCLAMALRDKFYENIAQCNSAFRKEIMLGRRCFSKKRDPGNEVVCRIPPFKRSGGSRNFDDQFTYCIFAFGHSTISAPMCRHKTIIFKNKMTYQNNISLSLELCCKPSKVLLKMNKSLNNDTTSRLRGYVNVCWW